MDESSFVRIEQNGPDGSKHYVIYTSDPKFALELSPDKEAPDRVGQGVIKSIRVPNSWAGDYAKYSKYITAAQRFFAASFVPPVDNAGTGRFRV